MTYQDALAASHSAKLHIHPKITNHKGFAEVNIMFPGLTWSISVPWVSFLHRHITVGIF
jgi:hypothetical protein